MTLSNAAAVHVRLIVWCRDSGETQRPYTRRALAKLAGCNAEDALADRRCHRVLDQLRRPAVGETNAPTT